MSESLTVDGWRVRVTTATDLVGDALDEWSVPRCRGAAIGVARSSGGCSSSPTSWASSSPSFSRTRSCRPIGEMGDRVSPGYEYLAFLLAIPGWLLLLRLEGLYDRDEERTDHSTVDDIVGVFRSVTIGVWVFALFGVATQPRAARARSARSLLAPGRRPDPDAPRRCAHPLPASAWLRAERRDRRRGQRWPAARAEADEPP